MTGYNVGMAKDLIKKGAGDVISQSPMQWYGAQEKVNLALAGLEPRDQISLFGQLFRVHQARGEDGKIARAELFGADYESTYKPIVAASLTATKRQFRLWEKTPQDHSISTEHVDSAGRNLVAHVDSRKDDWFPEAARDEILEAQEGRYLRTIYRGSVGDTLLYHLV